MDHITLGQPYKRIIDKSGQTTLKVSLYKDGQAGLFDIDDAEVISLTSNKALVTIPKWYFDTTGFLGIFYKDENDNVIEVVNATVVNESIAPIKLPETCIIKGSLAALGLCPLAGIAEETEELVYPPLKAVVADERAMPMRQAP